MTSNPRLDKRIAVPLVWCWALPVLKANRSLLAGHPRRTFHAGGPVGSMPDRETGAPGGGRLIVSGGYETVLIDGGKLPGRLTTAAGVTQGRVPWWLAEAETSADREAILEAATSEYMAYNPEPCE